MEALNQSENNKIDIFTKRLEVTFHNFYHFLSTILKF